MGIDFKQIFDFEMTPLMATAVFGSLFVVLLFAGFIVVKLVSERKQKQAVTPTTTAEQNLGDGI